MSFRKALILCVALPVLCAAGALAGGPSCRPGITAERPVIDGRLDESIWGKAETLGDFTLLGKDQPAIGQTKAYVLCDEANLYIGVTCLKAEPGRKPEPGAAGGNSFFLMENSLEIFIIPAEDPGQLYHHFRITVNGERTREPLREGAWLAATTGDEMAWYAEIAIPFDSIPLTLESGTIWRFNICREAKDPDEFSSWSPTASGFHDPPSFGRLILPYSIIAQRKATLFGGRLNELRETGSKFDSRLKGYPPAYMSSKLAQDLKERLSSLKERCKTLEGFLERWKSGPSERLDKDAYNLVREAEKTMEPLAALAAALDSAVAKKISPEADWYLTCESNMVKIRGDRPYDGSPAKEIRLSLAGNEYEPVQLVLVPVYKDIEGVSIEVSPLVSATGKTIGPQEITVEKVGYVNITKVSGRSYEEPGLFPDPLLPVTGEFDIPAGKVQPIWVTIYSRPDLPPGDYKGKITFRARNAGELVVDITAHVYDFSLPLRPALRTAYLLNTGYIGQWHRLTGRWTWTSNGVAYARYADNVERTSSTAASGKYSLTGAKHTSRWVHLIAPVNVMPTENTYLSFSYRFDDPGSLFVLFGGGSKNKFYTPPHQEPGQWHSAVTRIVDSGAEVGIGRDIQFVHDNRDSGKPHTLFVDDVVLYELNPDGTKKVLYQEDFGKEISISPMQDLVRHYRLNMLQHRVSDANVASPKIIVAKDDTVSIDWSEFDREIEFYREHGLSSFNINWLRIGGGWGSASTPEQESELKISAEIIRQTEAHLIEKGWIDDAYIYVFDEPGPDAFEKIRKAFEFVERHGPRLKRLLTYGYGATRPFVPGKEDEPAYAKLVDVVDINVPHIDCFDPRTLDSLRGKDKKEVWHYVCISAQHPYPNIWAIDYPGVENRVVYWQLWRYNITGTLYWCVTYWKQNVWEDPMSYPGGNGDGSLLYFGLPERVGEHRPLNSIRWELTREGIEDYDYLKILSDLVAQKALQLPAEVRERAERLLDVGDVSKSFTEYTSDPQVIIAHRQAVAEMIEELKRR